MTSETSTASDPFIYDIDRLKKIASDRIIKRGIAYFKENRVTDLTFDGETMYAKVEGSDPGLPYFVSISLDEDQELLVDCDCPFEWESVCKHAVATLLAYESKNNTKDDEIASASHLAISERAKRGRTQVHVEHVSGKPWFGMWKARSMTSHFATKGYDVQIRSLNERKNFCSCKDFATNLLGTCKHIESVIHKVKKEGQEYREPVHSFVYLAWDIPNAPRIRLHRATAIDNDLKIILDEFFDSNGFFRGKLPSDFFTFQNQCSPHEGLILGKDALNYVHLIYEEEEHRLEANLIKDRIIHSGGRLNGLKAKLYPYQTEGVAFLASTKRALLADDMGLGKTIQAIAAAQWLMDEGKSVRTLIVCPASLKAQWAREISKFTGQRVQIIQGNAKTRTMQYRQKAPFTIANYELILRDVFEINMNLAQDLLILDEAQRIKNWRTKTAAAVKLLQNKYLFVLTGTPLENRLEDLYSLIQLIDHRILGPLWQFLIKYHINDEQGKVLGYRNLAELRAKIAPVMLRRDRSLVRHQLPDRIETRMDVEMSPDQLRHHNSALASAFKFREIAKKRPLTPGETNMLMAALQNARMACDAVYLVDKETPGSPKLDEVAILLEEICVEGNGKVVIFSEWRKMTEMAAELVEKMNLGYVHLHGGIPTRQRGALMDAFREDPEVRVFLSTDAGGVGLNLQSGNVLINLDMPWNPAVLNQRIARIHRLGQKESVQVILMISKNSYEERVADLVSSKAELFDSVVMEDAENDVVGISRKTLAKLLDSLEQDQHPSSGKTPLDLEKPEIEEPGEKLEKSDDEQPNLTEEDLQVRATIEQLQNLLGSKLEMILGTNGTLLVVLDSISAEIDKQVLDLGSNIPIACIDTRTYHVLKRLGEGSPLSQAKPIYQQKKKDTEAKSPHVLTASRKLKAAEVLYEQNMTVEAMELLCLSMIASLAARNQLTEIPPMDQASVWVYSTALPNQMITTDEANTITKAIAFSQAPKLPENLLQDLFGEAHQWLHSV
jgi:superfamily II DNA or RNA helicase